MFTFQSNVASLDIFQQIESKVTEDMNNFLTRSIIEEEVYQTLQ